MKNETDDMKEFIESMDSNENEVIFSEIDLMVIAAETYLQLADIDLDMEIPLSLKTDILSIVCSINRIFDGRELEFGSEIISIFGKTVALLYSDIQDDNSIYCTTEDGPAFTEGILTINSVKRAFSEAELDYIVTSWRINYAKYFESSAKEKLFIMSLGFGEETTQRLRRFEERNDIECW